MTDKQYPLFFPGNVVITPAALEAITAAAQNPWHFIERHVMGDWPELSQEDKESNERAIEDGLRILSAYHSTKGTKIWIITEADRSSTTILLPEEY